MMGLVVEDTGAGVVLLYGEILVSGSENNGGFTRRQTGNRIDTKEMMPVMGNEGPIHYRPVDWES